MALASGWHRERKSGSSSRDDGAAIVLRKLSKRYGQGENTLSDIDLVVSRGEISAVVGRSGAGKSSLLKCIALLERPTSGSVHVNGQELTALGASDLVSARAQIGVIFQASGLLGRKTVAENIALPLRYAGMPALQRVARVDELLDRVGLAGRGKDYPHQLSGGQRQRIGIARALALKPAILLADEPTSGLDPETTDEFLSLLKDLRRELGLTVLLITHEMSVVRAIADQATLLEHGKIQETGRVRDLLSNPASALGEALLGRHASLPVPDGHDAWSITYAGAEVPTDWIGRLSARVSGRIALLGGVVENVGGQPAGRVTIALPSQEAGWFPGVLAELGLHGAIVQEVQA